MVRPQVAFMQCASSRGVRGHAPPPTPENFGILGTQIESGAIFRVKYQLQ